MDSFQKIFLNFLAKGESLKAKEFTPCGNLSTEDALDIYRNNYYQNLKKSLENTYEACRELLGEEGFSKLAYHYISGNKPTSSDVSSYGQNFAAFLREYAGVEIPFLFELASLEYAIKEVFLSSEGEAKRNIFISHPVHHIWQALLHGKDSVEELPGIGELVIERRGEGIFFDFFPQS